MLVEKTGLVRKSHWAGSMKQIQNQAPLMVSGSTKSIPRLSHTYQLALLPVFFFCFVLMGKEKEWKGTSYILWHVISGFSNGSESWWHLQVSLKEVLCLIMCHQNIYHLWIWGSRSEGGVLSYQFFIMEIMHVPEQKNKPWSLLDTQLQKYSFKAGRARGLSVLRVSNA